MQYNTLGTSDLKVSEISLGTMSIPDFSTGKKIIEKALEKGVNFFDTADLYQRGENEEIVGKVLKPHRKDVILATKVGNQWRPDGSGWDWNPHKSYIKTAVHESLRRLQTDYIDLYQLHGGTIDDPIDETIEAFEELKAEGHIRYYGISSIRHNVIQRYGLDSNIVSNMMQYSLLDRRPEEWALPFLEKQNVSVLVRGAIAKGLLAGKSARDYQIFDTLRVEELQIKLRNLSNEVYSEAELAIRYALAPQSVASVVIGASSAEQLEQTLLAAERPELDFSIIEQLREISPEWRYVAHR